MPKVSIVLPIHNMENGAFFLWRAINSIMEQTFKDYEIIITKEGSMPINSNAGIKRAKGEFIKILYMDDYFTHPNSLKEMIEVMDNQDWLIVGCNTNLEPYITTDIETGNNKLGSPSTLMFRNRGEDNLLFDEKLSWLLDCDLYKRMYKKYGSPKTLYGDYITIGIHEGQMTNILTEEEKLSEFKYLEQKYA